MLAQRPHGYGRRFSLYDAYMAQGAFSPSCSVGLHTLISAALYFDVLPSIEALERLITDDLSAFDSLAGPPVNGRWPVPSAVLTAAVDPEQHLFLVEVASEQDMAAYFEELMHQPLRNEGGALFELHAVHNRGVGRSALLVRVHHACGDGVALNQVLHRIAKRLDGSPLEPAPYTQRAPSERDSSCVACGLCAAVASNVQAAFGTPDSLLPSNAPTHADSHGGCCDCARSLRSSGRRRLLLVPPHSLNLIRRLKNVAGGATTVNDVMFAAFAGAGNDSCTM